MANSRVDKYEMEHPERNVWGNLTLDQVLEYRNKEEGAPSAQEVFDHYWSILNYAFTDEEKREFLALPAEQGVDRLLALGGEVWNTYVTVDLTAPYDYSREELALEGSVSGFDFTLPKTPIDLLRAGLSAELDVCENVLERYDFPEFLSIVVSKDGKPVDVVSAKSDRKTIDASLDVAKPTDRNESEVETAEKEWAEAHGYKHIPTIKMIMTLRL